MFEKQYVFARFHTILHSYGRNGHEFRLINEFPALQPWSAFTFILSKRAVCIHILLAMP